MCVFVLNKQEFLANIFLNVLRYTNLWIFALILMNIVCYLIRRDACSVHPFRRLLLLILHRNDCSSPIWNSLCESNFDLNIQQYHWEKTLSFSIDKFILINLTISLISSLDSVPYPSIHFFHWCVRRICLRFRLKIFNTKMCTFSRHPSKKMLKCSTLFVCVCFPI